MTVEQCCALLLAHVLSLYSGRGDRGLAFGPKGKDLGFLLDGRPYTKRTVGGGEGAVEKTPKEKPDVGFTLNYIFCSSLPRHHHLIYTLPRSDQGCVSECVCGM